MSAELLRQYIAEALMDQNVVRKDPAGEKVLKKLVTFRKPGSMFSSGADVDTEFDSAGNIVVDDVEKWEPDYTNPPTKSKHGGKGKPGSRVRRNDSRVKHYRLA